MKFPLVNTFSRRSNSLFISIEHVRHFLSKSAVKKVPRHAKGVGKDFSTLTALPAAKALSRFLCSSRCDLEKRLSEPVHPGSGNQRTPRRNGFPAVSAGRDLAGERVTWWALLRKTPRQSDTLFATALFALWNSILSAMPDSCLAPIIAVINFLSIDSEL